MAELGKDFIINEYGEIVHLNGDGVKNKSADDKLMDERDQLEYEIFSHADRFSPEELATKKARFAELEKQLGMTKNVNVFNAGQDLLKRRMAKMNANGQSNSEIFTNNIAAQKDRG